MAARKPPWLKVKSPASPAAARTGRLLARTGTDTICAAAGCPNRGECWSRGLATFLILGPNCSRRCAYCRVTAGRPAPVDPGEPGRVARAAAELELDYAVVTSVTRDDLPDGGAAAFAATVAAVKERCGCRVEVLLPDFAGRFAGLDAIVAAGADVLGHNLEVVRPLFPSLRPGGDYDRSLALLRELAARAGGRPVKSGLMVGLGETPGQARRALADLAAAGVSLATVGQYLAPSAAHAPIARYWEPAEFAALAAAGRAAGLKQVAAGPLVRSSYRAEELAGMQADGHIH